MVEFKHLVASMFTFTMNRGSTQWDTMGHGTQLGTILEYSDWRLGSGNYRWMGYALENIDGGSRQGKKKECAN